MMSTFAVNKVKLPLSNCMTRIVHHHNKKRQRAFRTRVKLHGTAVRPRVTVFRSNRYIWAQAIDDTAGKVMVAASDSSKAITKETADVTKTAAAQVLGKHLAELLKSASITQVVFDRGPYRYHGRVAAICEGLRTAGIQV